MEMKENKEVTLGRDRMEIDCEGKMRSVRWLRRQGRKPGRTGEGYYSKRERRR